MGWQNKARSARTKMQKALVAAQAARERAGQAFGALVDGPFGAAGDAVAEAVDAAEEASMSDNEGVAERASDALDSLAEATLEQDDLVEDLDQLLEFFDNVIEQAEEAIAALDEALGG